MALTDLFSHALYVALICSAVPLAAGSIAALTVSIIQAATQVQEQTVTYLVRVATFSGVTFVGGGWAVREITSLLHETFGVLVAIGKG